MSSFIFSAFSSLLRFRDRNLDFKEFFWGDSRKIFALSLMFSDMREKFYDLVVKIFVDSGHDFTAT